MRQTSFACAEWPIYLGLNERTMANIQRKIDERNKRNVFSRALHAQGDKDAIAAWKQEFNKILQIFNVRSVGSV